MLPPAYSHKVHPSAGTCETNALIWKRVVVANLPQVSELLGYEQAPSHCSYKDKIWIIYSDPTVVITPTWSTYDRAKALLRYIWRIDGETAPGYSFGLSFPLGSSSSTEEGQITAHDLVR